MSPRYFYLELEPNKSVTTALSIRLQVESALREVFGEVGAAEQVEVVRGGGGGSAGGGGVLRVRPGALRRVHAATGLAGNLRVKRVAASLLAMMATTHESKDVIIIATREQLSTPSTVVLPPAEAAPGLLLQDGSINWGCPCLGGMATGPCGTQFREAFSCFHYSEAEPKGSDCYEKFSVMQDCMGKYPELYGRDEDEDDALADAMAGAASEDERKK